MVLNFCFVFKKILKETVLWYLLFFLPYFPCNTHFTVQHYLLFSPEKKGRNSGKSRWIQLTECRSVREQSWVNQLNEGRGAAKTRM